MAILKKEYELSVWDETLGEKGQKEEVKRAIIGAHDMSYDGRATALKLSRKINGTNVLTFQMPSKYFNSELGEYIHNEFCDYIFNERKLKLKYDGEWFEFYVKNISENKQFKSIMYQYQCEDAFIDELSRNGYGITFDTELYNNVEEIGVFTEQILEDSIWEYDASKNWGDFTEYAEEKLFKIPVSMFNKIEGYKLNYQVDGELTNPFSGETKKLEMGDDLSREKKVFWDNGDFDNGIPLLKQKSENIANDGYIYIPYSCLNFCYVSNDKDGEGFAATQEAVTGEIRNIKSYYLTPDSIDPTFLIQFIAIPTGAEVQIDEAGLLVNKDYTYVMTLADWNKNVNTGVYYDSEKKQMEKSLVSNSVVCYNGYLEKIGDVDIAFGKKISITDRTEINISEDIGQYVTVYNNSENEYNSMFTSDEWLDSKDKYRICSYEATRMIVPQLARNLIQNGTEMTDTSGWDIMKSYIGVDSTSASITVKVETSNETESTNDLSVSAPQGLIFHGCAKPGNDEKVADSEKGLYSSFINFGIVGQEEIISKEQTYVFRMNGEWLTQKNENEQITYEPDPSRNTIKVYLGEGSYDADGDYNVSKLIELPTPNGKNYFIRPTINIKNPYLVIEAPASAPDIVYNLKEVILAKAYTKGIDFFNKEEKGFYRYTGRDIFFNKDTWTKKNNYYYRQCETNEFLSETDIVEGDAYAYKRYFRQQVQAGGTARDTFSLKSYLNNDVEKNGYDPIEYTEDDLKIITDYIDLNQCKYYNSTAKTNEKDCKHNCSSNGLCMYQKYGYCPYLFQTQKHCRKIRTLNGEKSNRFNLTQELSKVFEIYPVYYIEHKENGKIVTDLVTNEDGTSYEKMRKKVFYITEKGVENKLGFKYEKNLSNISRTFDSKEIVTKLYVEDVDSELSKTGLCSIKTAEDNPSKDSYIIDFSYYIMRGLLDKETTNADLYGKDEQDMGYLKTLGYYNGEYDRLSNLIINLQDESYTELQANIEVNLTGIETAQKELNKIKKNMSKYSAAKKNSKTDEVKESDTYKNYKVKYAEQKNVLLGLIEDTFMTNGAYDYTLEIQDWGGAANAEELLDRISAYGFKKFKEDYLDTFKYKNCGMMGQYTAEHLQIQEWKKQRARYLKDINRISLAFYQKYEPYLKEGTWSDSNYLSDNSYYFGAKEVAKQGAIPKLTYSISVVDLSILDGDYKIGIADTTYIEDIETFGVNKETGFPNRLKVIVSGITYDLDTPTQNSIEIQNYTTQFEDLFQQVSASVQSLSFNENIYKRSSNFTSTQNITGESLQGGLMDNQLTLLETDEKNISLDHNGQSGSDINNHANKYKLTGEGLFFSNNGGQTWNVGVTPKGINADYINVGSLDASKISIVDGSYLYFLWDKGGITAYRTPQANGDRSSYFQDFARFNKYGLSLVENGQIRLRAGYEYNGTEGAIANEADINGDTNIGFYLYNNKGETIFATTSGDDENETARIQLKGEIYITNTNIKNTVKGNDITFYKGSCIIKEENCFMRKTETEYLNEQKNLKRKDLEVIKKLIGGEESEGWTIDSPILQTEKYECIKIDNILSIQKDVTKIYRQSFIKNIDDSENITTTKQFICYYSKKENSEKDEVEYFYTQQKCNILTDKDVNKELKVKKEPITKKTIIYFDITSGESPYQQKTSSFYKRQDGTNLYYLSATHQEGTEDTMTNGQIGLYINNKIGWKNSSDNEEENGTQRLFSCVAIVANKTEDENKEETENESKQENNENILGNLFTILKNGNLYIGGEVVQDNGEALPEPNANNLPTNIGINSPILEISNGNMYMDFDKIKWRGSDGEEVDLVTYIAQQIADSGAVLVRHRHEIKKLIIPNESTSKEGFWFGKMAINKENLFDKQVTWSDLQNLFTKGEVFADSNGVKGIKFSHCFYANDGDSKIYLDLTDTYTEYAGALSGGAVSGAALADPVQD